MKKTFANTKKTAKKLLLERTFRTAYGSPVIIANREEKLKSISDAIHSLATAKKADNLFIYGESGTGKSMYIRHLISTLQDVGSVIPVYINCHEHQTKMAVYNRIVQEMDNSFSRRGFASYEIFKKIKELIHEEKKSILLILDDVEALGGNNAGDLLYPIIEENGAMQDSFAVIAISDDFRAFEELDGKIKSSFMFRVIEFEPYSREEIKQILNSVANAALAEDSYEEGVLDKIAELGESGEGNARFAIWLLFASAKRAERRHSAKIRLVDVKTVYERILPLSPSSQEVNGSDLSQGEILILDILKVGEKSSSEMYEIFLKKTGKSKRQVRNYLNSVIEKGHVEYEVVENTNSTLKPRVFRLKKGAMECSS